MNKYLIGSGYHWNNSERGIDTFYPIWIDNLKKIPNPPSQVFIIADSNCRPPTGDVSGPTPFEVNVIYLTGDLGSCHTLITGSKPHAFAGWTGAVLATAMLAYCDEKDFIFVEQDALMFGDCIGTMYSEIGDAGIIFGDCTWMAAEQSLFLVKHFYIPEFIRLFLNEGPHKEGNLSEEVFKRLEEAHPDQWKRFSLQFGRNRPINFDDPVWYAQKLTADEMAELKNRGMI